MNAREKGKINERKVLKAIKTFPKVKGYYVVNYSKIGEKLNMRGSLVRQVVNRLLRKNLIEEVRESVALFGSMRVRGIKIAPNYAKDGVNLKENDF